MLGLGYPGGPALERLAREGDPQTFDFPTAARLQGLDFSFAGLKTALLVGFATAKALAAARELPLAPVDHLHGHVAASFLRPDPFDPPFLSLIASGGHTMLAIVRDRGPGFEVIGQTLDDAAG